MTAEHSAQFEELMALLDGELPRDAADRVRTHLNSCGECQRLANGLGAISERVSAWQVGDAPETLRARKTGWRLVTPRWLATAAALVIVGVAVAVVMQRQNRAPSLEVPEVRVKLPIAGRAVEEHANANAMRPPQANVSVPAAVAEQVAISQPKREDGGPLIIRNASLSVIVRDFERARGDLDRIATSVSGFIGNLVASGARGAAPSLNATLRVPANRLGDTLAALKALGDVQHESQNSDDVTQRSADLDARLSNARGSEARLKEVLKNRTGRLSDVLDVEREIARVRGEIEQMEAERKNMDSRIAYATVNVELTSERKAEAVTGRLSISTRLRNAVVDGFAAAVEHAISFAVFAAEVLPTLLLWVVILGPPALFIRRRLAGRI